MTDHVKVNVYVKIGLTWLKGLTGVKEQIVNCDHTCLSNNNHTVDLLPRVKLD
jgi:hypothetical protein